MKYYNVTFEIDKMGTKVVKLTEDQLLEGLKAWNNRRSVNIPTVGLIRGRSITKFVYELIEVKTADEQLTVEKDTFLTKVSDSNPHNITFQNADNEQVGKLSWDDGVFKFEGEAEESARIFFKIIQNLVETANNG